MYTYEHFEQSSSTGFVSNGEQHVLQNKTGFVTKQNLISYKAGFCTTQTVKKQKWKCYRAFLE